MGYVVHLFYKVIYNTKWDKIIGWGGLMITVRYKIILRC